MTASSYIKSRGLPSLQFVADTVDKPRQTINYYYKNNFKLFKVVVAGVLMNILQEKAKGYFEDNPDKDHITITFERESE